MPYVSCLLYMQGMFIKTANFRDMTVAPGAESAGTRFTCFTGTKAYWYKYMDVVPEAEHDESVGTRFTCFTGTKVRALLVQILTQKERRLSAFFFLSVELDRSQETVLKRRGNTFFFFGQWS